MTHGVWSFLHEWAVYEYLNARFDEGVLRLKPVVKASTPVLKEKWKKVDELSPITDSRFPDVKSIQLSGETNSRCAEVKFTTSEFNYHNSAIQTFQDFTTKNGFILVLAHDYLPAGLEHYKIDVFELDQSDFETWCRVNFARLYNRQIGNRAESRIWIMYQGPNFNQGNSDAKPARTSHIWCPTENLTGFDLAPRDRVLFVKTSGSSTQSIQKAYLKHIGVSEKWSLEEIYVAEVVSKIYNRNEYCLRRKLDFDKPLWKIDPKQKQNWRWNRVFEFRPLIRVEKKISMRKWFDSDLTNSFVEAVIQTFCYQKSREINLGTYTRTLESLAGVSS
jgi:diphthamide synthase (EF-2-diphthine--ammonia ligase)